MVFSVEVQLPLWLLFFSNPKMAFFLLTRWLCFVQVRAVFRLPGKNFFAGKEVARSFSNETVPCRVSVTRKNSNAFGWVPTNNFGDSVSMLTRLPWEWSLFTTYVVVASESGVVRTLSVFLAHATCKLRLLRSSVYSVHTSLDHFKFFSKIESPSTAPFLLLQGNLLCDSGAMVFAIFFVVARSASRIRQIFSVCHVCEVFCWKFRTCTTMSFWISSVLITSVANCGVNFPVGFVP